MFFVFISLVLSVLLYCCIYIYVYMSACVFFLLFLGCHNFLMIPQNLALCLCTGEKKISFGGDRRKECVTARKKSLKKWKRDWILMKILFNKATVFTIYFTLQLQGFCFDCVSKITFVILSNSFCGKAKDDVLFIFCLQRLKVDWGFCIWKYKCIKWVAYYRTQKPSPEWCNTPSKHN